LRKIVVSGGGISTAEGRVFEDMFVQKLCAAGVDAVARPTPSRPIARAAMVLRF
jgi:hypothetical protein